MRSHGCVAELDTQKTSAHHLQNTMPKQLLVREIVCVCKQVAGGCPIQHVRQCLLWLSGKPALSLRRYIDLELLTKVL